MVLTLASFLLGLPLSDRLAILGSNHYCLGGFPDIVFQSRVFVRPSV